MFNWFKKLCASLVFTVIAYLTNPIVALFADNDGELHGVLHYWQTWDNSCNPSDLVDILPSWLTPWYFGHYEEVYRSKGKLKEYNCGRWYTDCVDPDFTLWERFTRYLCRVYWLTRNSAYGFCFYLLGIDFNPSHTLSIKIDGKEEMIKDLDDSDVWSYCNSNKIIGNLEWNIYLGYKLRLSATKPTHCMIANRIAFKINKKD